MQRVLAMMASVLLLLVGGCGLKSYEARLDKTLDDMKYNERLNKNLMPPETKPDWDRFGIYLRPPQLLKAQKAWLLSPTEQGKFDIEVSFDEPQKQSLHVLARMKQQKTAAKKKSAPTKADTADRTNFNRDVLNVLTASYSPPDELRIEKFKPVTQKRNDFRFYAFSANDKTVEVYLYKKDEFEVALIFEFPKAEKNTLVSKIELCLGSFAVGATAKRFFSGSTSEEEAGPAGPGVAF